MITSIFWFAEKVFALFVGVCWRERERERDATWGLQLTFFFFLIFDRKWSIMLLYYYATTVVLLYSIVQHSFEARLRPSPPLPSLPSFLPCRAVPCRAVVHVCLLFTPAWHILCKPCPKSTLAIITKHGPGFRVGPQI